MGELEKIATHYGIVRGGKMIAEMTAEELEANCRTFVALQTKKMDMTKALLERKYNRVSLENDYIRIYDNVKAEEVAEYLFKELKTVVTEKYA